MTIDRSPSRKLSVPAVGDRVAYSATYLDASLGKTAIGRGMRPSFLIDPTERSRIRGVVVSRHEDFSELVTVAWDWAVGRPEGLIGVNVANLVLENEVALDSRLFEDASINREPPIKGLSGAPMLNPVIRGKRDGGEFTSDNAAEFYQAFIGISADRLDERCLKISLMRKVSNADRDVVIAAIATACAESSTGAR